MPTTGLDSSKYDLKLLGGRKMKQRGHQEGYVKTISGWRVGFWCVYIRRPDESEVRRKRQQRLGKVSQMTLRAVREELYKIIREEPSTTVALPDGEQTFGWFTENVFLKRLVRDRRNITGIVNRYILPSLSRLPLNRIKRHQVEDCIFSLKGYSESILKKTRRVCSTILNSAVDYEYISRNPATKVKLPPHKAVDQRIITPDRLQKLLAALDLREHLMLRMLWTLGLRASELFARRWRDVIGNTLKIEDRVSRNKFGPTKTRSSRAHVALSSQLVMMLNAYRETAKFTEPNDLIFCAVRRNFSKLNYRRGVPVDHHNLLRRFLVPKLEELGLSRMNFQMFRRSCATFMMVNGSVKDAQEHLSP